MTVSVSTGTATSTDLVQNTLQCTTGVARGTGTFTLTPVSDDLDESDETVTVSGTTTTTGLTVNGTTVTITDDDDRSVEVSPTSLSQCGSQTDGCNRGRSIWRCGCEWFTVDIYDKQLEYRTDRDSQCGSGR